MSTWAVILAAGQSSRLARPGVATKKQYIEWRGRPLFWHSVRTLAGHPAMRGVVLVFPPDELEEMRTVAEGLEAEEPLGVALRFAPGGERRQDSVLSGLGALPGDCRLVLVHDAARPFVTPGLVARLVEAVAGGASGAIPAVPVKDTVKRVRDGVVEATLPRDELAAVQTPQAFDLRVLRDAFARAGEIDVTDDASLVEHLGLEVRVVDGEEGNCKITTPEDLKRLGGREESGMVQATRIPVVGYGYDVHRYGQDGPNVRPMRLGGVPIAGGPGVVAHSDGDVLLHALTDALLGCLGLGDIGQHFPDTDQQYSGIDSAILLNEVLLLAQRSGLELAHVDLTIVAQVPKIGPHREQIRRNVARLLALDFDQVNVKATTEEGLGFTGAKLGLKCVAVVTALKAGKVTKIGAEPDNG